ncbi:MAG: FtsX-like permease family protein, partial [Ginsengibacter sp.]
LASLDFKKKQFLLPLTKIHLESGVDNDVTPSGSLIYLYILGSIALFTLLIACINFMNLSTARSSKRSAEVGIRKVLGAEKSLLVRQFLGESIFMSLLAFLLAIVISLMLLPAFNTISGRNISVTFEKNGWLFAAFLLMSVFAGLLAGSYPAFYLSSFRPVKVLKGKFSNSMAAISLRKGLVVFQFIISVVLIIAAVVIASQMKYLRSADLGFDKERQVIVPLRSQVAKKIGLALKADIKKLSGIKEVGESFYNPGRFNPSDNSFYKESKTMQDGKRTRLNVVDENYLQTLNLQVLAGRLFSVDFPSDTAGGRIILNETAIKEIGFKSAQDAVGKKIYSTYNGETNDREVIGVVNDFHFEDLHLPITPFGFLRNNDDQYNYMLVHAAPGNIGNLLKSIGDRWKKFNPNEPFEYSFLDQDFQKNYESEIRLASIVNYFTIIAILISCLGLFGLATFSAEQRIKEIGVRKVLGASVANIVTLLSKDFLKLVAISIIIASPVAWYVMNKWLQDFAYRIDIGWSVFAITTFIALLIAIATISFQAIRAAIANPVKSLRAE